MQLESAVAQALNNQINLELSSAYAYLGMAVYFEHEGLQGFASWMQLQGQEELAHARKFLDYLLDRGGRIDLQAIEAPTVTYVSPLAAFEASLAQEQTVSAAICSIFELAQGTKDFPTLSFLKWFLDEQVEEERTVTDMIAHLKLAGDSPAGLIQLDRVASARATSK
jgi:ferritin